MRQLRWHGSFLHRLLRNERGNFAMIMAIVAIPLMGIVGLGIDLTRAYIAQTRLQNAVDNAALAAAGMAGMCASSTDTSAQCIKMKQITANYFYSNYHANFWAPPAAPVVTIDDDGTAHVSATANSPNYFLVIFGYQQFTVASTADAIGGSTGLEVAMVLDITSSMDASDMTSLKNASTELVNILFGTQDTPTTLAIGIVPFTSSVRLDPATAVTGTNGVSWIDTTGSSSVARLNFDNSYANNYAFALYKTPSGSGYMSNTPWVGCVEARPTSVINGSTVHLEETDDPPDASKPDTRWVPFFAPDDPDSIPTVDYATTSNITLSGEQKIDGNTKTNKSRVLVKNQTTASQNGIYVTSSGAWTRATDADTPAALNRATFTVSNGSTNRNTQWTEMSVIATIDTSNVTFATSTNFVNNYLSDVTTATGTVARQTYTKKYQGKSPSTTGGYNSNGPDRNCVISAIQPLTNNKTTLINMINGLKANGYTHIPLGIGWGWRVLSSGPPYTEGHDENDPNWKKVLIIETDGCNTMPSTANCTSTTPDTNPWGSDYSAYGFAYQQRLGAGVDNTVKMMAAENTSMANVCANIKAVKKTDGTPVYTVYTIGFGTEVKQNGNETLLKGCATLDPKTGLPNYYYAPTQADLEEVFKTIGSNLSKVRLTK